MTLLPKIIIFELRSLLFGFDAEKCVDLMNEIADWEIARGFHYDSA